MKQDLQPIARQVGADVTFFLDGGGALVEGVGERVTLIPSAAAWYAIAWPEIELSTAEVYRAWDEVKGEGPNDLRRAAERVEPKLEEFAVSLGPHWQMTGSGSAFFKQCENEEAALKAIASFDCVGGWRTLGDAELAVAQLPLITRGARTVDKDPSAGIRGGRVAGRRVEIVRGCSESGEFSTLTQVARQLVERERVDAVVAGGFDSVDGIPLREVARRYPDVPLW